LHALQAEDPDELLKYLLRAQRVIPILKPLPYTTWTEILRVLDPSFFLEKFKSVNRHFSAGGALDHGLPRTKAVLRGFMRKMRIVMLLRKEAGYPMGVPEYSFLLDCCRVIGDGATAEAVWLAMESDQVQPDANCYHHYMAAQCWAGAFLPEQRHQQRILPRKQNVRGYYRSLAVPEVKTGEGGVEEQVLRLFSEMIQQGLAADEKTYSLLLLAMAREGDLKGMAAVLKRGWNVDVESLDDKSSVVTPYPEGSPLYPSSYLFHTLAHAYGINNDVALALRLVDYFAEAYSIEISSDVWEELFDRVFQLSRPRHGGAIIRGNLAGYISDENVHRLWETMTSATYNVPPTMAMYNKLHRCYRKDMNIDEARKALEAGLSLYHAALRQRQTARKRLALAQEREEVESAHISIGPSLPQLRRDLDLSTWWCDRHFMWLMRGVRTLLRGKQSFAWERRGLPNALNRWRAFLLPEVSYPIATGWVTIRPNGMLAARKEQFRLAMLGNW
jgi:hypothetical protein